jgi:hypothetical protein
MAKYAMLLLVKYIYARIAASTWACSTLAPTIAALSHDRRFLHELAYIVIIDVRLKENLHHVILAGQMSLRSCYDISAANRINNFKS